MAKLARITQPIFAGNAPQEDTAVFGTMKTAPVYTSDVATSIDTTAFSNGWKDAVEVGYAPFLEEMNTVQKAFSYQVAYNQQQGISEWGDDVEYNIGSLVKVNTANGSQVYSSLADNNVGNLVNDNTKWKLVLDSTIDYATVAQLNTKADNNAVVHTTGNESIYGTKTFSDIVYGASPASYANGTSLATTQWVRSLNSTSSSASPTNWNRYYESIMGVVHIEHGQYGGAFSNHRVTITFLQPFANVSYSVALTTRASDSSVTNPALSTIANPSRNTSNCVIWGRSDSDSRGFDYIVIGR